MNKKIIKFKKDSLTFSLLWLSPYILFTLIFLLIAFFLLIVNSFVFNQDALKLVSNPVILKILWRSIWVGIITAFIVVFVALIYIWISLQIPYKSIRFFLIFLLELQLFIFTISKIWSLKGVYMQFFDHHLLNSHWFMILGLVLLYLPLGAIPIYNVLRGMPKQIVEASYSLGFNHIKTFWLVILPYTLRAISKSWVIVFLTAAMTIIVSEKLLPNGSNHTMIGNVISSLIHNFSDYDIAQLVVLIIVTLIVLISVCGLMQLLSNLFMSFFKVGSYVRKSSKSL